ncbi:hypothetical protein ABT354_22775 [Streptomyces sp. NPDC000594]|uniref:hypothetical protein n=1 Tax=Streptomyces sp. NPDC000594 TaxID=3154261 RepID=UPI003323EE12
MITTRNALTTLVASGAVLAGTVLPASAGTQQVLPEVRVLSATATPHTFHVAYRCAPGSGVRAIALQADMNTAGHYHYVNTTIHQWDAPHPDPGSPAPEVPLCDGTWQIAHEEITGFLPGTTPFHAGDQVTVNWKAYSAGMGTVLAEGQQAGVVFE